MQAVFMCSNPLRSPTLLCHSAISLEIIILPYAAQDSRPHKKLYWDSQALFRQAKAVQPKLRKNNIN